MGGAVVVHLDHEVAIVRAAFQQVVARLPAPARVGRAGHKHVGQRAAVYGELRQREARVARQQLAGWCARRQRLGPGQRRIRQHVASIGWRTAHVRHRAIATAAAILRVAWHQPAILGQRAAAVAGVRHCGERGGEPGVVAIFTARRADGAGRALPAHVFAVVDQQHVAAREADVVQPRAVGRGRAHRQAQVERQRVAGIPRHLQQQGAVQRIDGRLDGREANRIAMCGIGIGRIAGLRAQHFLEDQQVADSQFQRARRRACGIRCRQQHGGRLRRRRRRVDQGRPCAAARQAAQLVAPAVQADRAVRGDHVEASHAIQRHRLVDQRARRPRRRELGRVDDARRRLRRPRRRHQQQQVVQFQTQVVAARQRDEGARIAAFVHAVIDQPRMPAHRDALARGAQVGLGGDRVLVVAELVGGVRQRLHQCDAEVRHVALLPCRHAQREAVEEQLAEAGIVLRQVVDLRRGRRWRHARRLVGAVQRLRAVEAEVQRGAGVARIEAGIGLPARRVVAGGRLHQAQTVRGVVAFAVEHHAQAGVVVQLRFQLGVHAEHAQAGDALAAADAHVGHAEALRNLAEQVHAQAHAVVADLDVVDAVERAGQPQLVAPRRHAAGRQRRAADRAEARMDVRAVHGRLRTKLSLRVSPLARTV